MERDERAETVKGDLHDGIDELGERVKAGGEALKRTVAGDSMSPAEKLGSHVKEMGHDLRADFDKTKREGE